MQQVKWFEREFRFDSNQNILPSIIERLWGTPVRLQEKIKLISTDVLVLREQKTWTIKENIGHLCDLESLWKGRLEDILNGKVELRTTDLSNAKPMRQITMKSQLTNSSAHFVSFVVKH